MLTLPCGGEGGGRRQLYTCSYEQFLQGNDTGSVRFVFGVFPSVFPFFPPRWLRLPVYLCLLCCLLHCALAAAQCIVIGPVCGFVCVFVGLLPR